MLWRKKAFSKASKIEFIAVEGGYAKGNPCADGYHQFAGIEAETTKQIADWMKANKPRAQ
jgi:hypothetical protein